ncbi:hypothetical protein NC651_029453 [Populus alba x Populus x berolinensis]|nr:hypothetical protein NC651_029453 [Populus alba x Populus x berolinensis]
MRKKISEPFKNSFSRACSGDPSSFDEQFNDLSEAGASRSLTCLSEQPLSRRKQEEIPNYSRVYAKKSHRRSLSVELVSHNEQGKHFAWVLAHAASGYQRVLEENRKAIQSSAGPERTPSKYSKEGRKSFSFNKVFGPLATHDRSQGAHRGKFWCKLQGFERSIYLSDQRKDLFAMISLVQMLEIYNEQKFETVLRMELRNRADSATAMNDRSSRSHSLPEQFMFKGGEVGIWNSYPWFNASSVTWQEVNGLTNPEVTGDRLKEALHINRSLSALGDVIASLAQKKLTRSLPEQQTHCNFYQIHLLAIAQRSITSSGSITSGHRAHGGWLGDNYSSVPMLGRRSVGSPRFDNVFDIHGYLLSSPSLSGKDDDRGIRVWSLIPSLIPSPSRKLPNGVSPGLNKPGRQLVSVDGKRKTGHAK